MSILMEASIMLGVMAAIMGMLIYGFEEEEPCSNDCCCNK
jgi:hypothetical protein